METSVMNGMCRCCASEGAFKDVKSSYHWMGQEEVYGDMLRECFDISLSISEGEQGSICELCITQLRNAVNFKKQVLHTEDQFKTQLQNKLFKPSIVKVELPADDINDSGDNLSADEDYSGPEFEVPIKTETPDEPKVKKRAAKATTSRAKRAKTNAGETSTKHNQRTTRSMDTRTVSPITSNDSENKITLDKKANFSSFITIRPVGKRTLPSVRTQQMRLSEQKRLTELDWHFDNIKSVLKCSNATPIRCKVGSRYACSFCLDQFPNPADLKNHTLETHENDRPHFLLNMKSLSRHVVNLDTTSLRCKICDSNIDQLEQLMEHLKSTHDKVIHLQIKNQIIPFRFEGSVMLCAVCSEEIADFNDLQDHMSRHYKNYICEFCDASFVIRCKMLDHKKVVHRV